MNLFFRRLVIHPEDNKELAYWTRKWRVGTRQINDAILETGSTDLRDIKMVLRRKGELGKIVFWLHKLLKVS